ncbi:MAG: FliH/SctL family protein [Bdellovibrionota bacterium]
MTFQRTGTEPKKIDIKEEATKSTDVRVVKIDTSREPDVRTFDFPKIQKAGDGDYGATKAKFGPLAATDAERVARAQKDRRFSLNPLLRDPLSVEQEERRVIEEKVRARVSALADDAKAEAAAVGYQDGLQKGYDEAYARFQKEAGERLGYLDQFLEAAETSKAEIFKANERFVMETVFRIARMVVLRELQTDKDYLLRLTRELIERVGVRDNISILINPEDLVSVKMLKDGLEQSLGALSNLNVEASTQIKRGGCSIETQWNLIDAAIDTQLQGLYEGLVAKTASEEPTT